MIFFSFFRAGALALGVAALTAACVPVTQDGTPVKRASSVAATKPAASSAAQKAKQAAFKADRKAILAMTGEYGVSFEFRETVVLHEGYELKEPKFSGGNEVVRVLEDTGEFISLQHILLVGPDSNVVVKHWRQDWIYEPEVVWDFVGRNTWEKRTLSPKERKGKWAQLVYQVDDAPRYSGVAAWKHEKGVSAWTSKPSWRPLPRRDATTRDDYDAIVAVNRHVITPEGWVHEQDNSKMVLADEPYFLVREVGVNTYRMADGAYDPAPADDYMEATAAFWAAIREEWVRVVSEHDRFGLNVEGEPEPVYMPILGIAQAVADGEEEPETGAAEAIEILRSFLVTDGHDSAARDGDAS